MSNFSSDIGQVDVFDPYDILPIEKTIKCFGERR